MDVYGGVEAGGTKFVCAVANGPEQILAETRFATRQPAETMSEAVRFFKDYQSKSGNRLIALGIGAFGPLDLNKKSATFGNITTTPKPGWANAPLLPTLQAELQVPTFIDTDVNAAAIGEGTWGSARGCSDFLYLTIGTGIGGGAIVNGQPVQGLVHPEMGHILLPHDWQKDPYGGFCPYHGDCFEGLAAGPAIERRWSTPGFQLPVDHPAWDLEAQYIASALHILITAYSPRMIILGGGVMQQPQLFPLVRRKTQESLHGYVQSPEILEHIDRYILPPGLGNYAGVLGAIALAIRANQEQA